VPGNASGQVVLVDTDVVRDSGEQMQLAVSRADCRFFPNSKFFWAFRLDMEEFETERKANATDR
jgi:hypothetical protein